MSILSQPKYPEYGGYRQGRYGQAVTLPWDRQLILMHELWGYADVISAMTQSQLYYYFLHTGPAPTNCHFQLNISCTGSFIAGFREGPGIGVLGDSLQAFNFCRYCTIHTGDTYRLKMWKNSTFAAGDSGMIIGLGASGAGSGAGNAISGSFSTLEYVLKPDTFYGIKTMTLTNQSYMVISAFFHETLEER